MYLVPAADGVGKCLHLLQLVVHEVCMCIHYQTLSWTSWRTVGTSSLGWGIWQAVCAGTPRGNCKYRVHEGRGCRCGCVCSKFQAGLADD